MYSLYFIFSFLTETNSSFNFSKFEVDVFNSSLIEPYVTIENSKKIEIDPLEVLKHKWTVDLTMAYINLDKEYKVYGEICADILEQGLRKVCYRKDEKGNLILRPLEIKENEIGCQVKNLDTFILSTYNHLCKN